MYLSNNHDHPLPAALLDALQGVAGFDRLAFERVHGEGRQVVSIRLNPQKGGADIDAFATVWSTPPLDIRPVPWSSFGYYLSQRPSFTLDPFFHAGVYYVQEASSMFLEEALRQTAGLSRPLKVLDLCAAPGGKSALIQSLLASGSLLVSNEAIRSRTAILEENMTKWGASALIVTQNDARDFQRLENYFDVLVVDAPCSGSGLFRRDPAAIQHWSLDHVRHCSQRGQRILADVWPALKKDGLLIYCTCSYSKEEDEDILDWILAGWNAESLSLRIQEDWKIVSSVSARGGRGYRFYPDKVEGEGFFLACFRKTDGGDPSVPRNRKQRQGKLSGNPSRLSRAEEELARRWTRTEEPLFFFRHQEYIQALPETLAAELPLLQSVLHLKKAGIRLGKPVQGELNPDHALALSTIVSEGIFSVDLPKEDALRYLRKEEIAVKSDEKGWILVRYGGYPLGWIKVLQNRVNNYYPAAWRILKPGDS